MDVFDKDIKFKPDRLKYVRQTEDMNLVKQRLSELTETPGYNQLNETQQKMVRVSVLLSNRAFRKTDTPSARAIGVSEFTHEPWLYTESEMKRRLPRLNPKDPKHLDIKYEYDPAIRKYRGSQNFIASLDCFQSVYSLERQKWISADPWKLIDSKDFFNGEALDFSLLYAKGADFVKNALESAFKKTGFPCVLFLNINLNPNISDHAMVVLGPNQKGDVLCWEKMCYGPYVIAPIHSSLERWVYEPARHGTTTLLIRKLKK